MRRFLFWAVIIVAGISWLGSRQKDVRPSALSLTPPAATNPSSMSAPEAAPAAPNVTETVRAKLKAANSKTVFVRGQDVSVHDLLTSAWTYPENIRYAIIRERHDKGDDRAYVPEASRILIAMAHAAAEIIGSRQPEAPTVDDIRKMITWFGSHAVPGIEQAIGNRRSSSS